MVKKLALIGIAISISIVFVACVIHTVPDYEGFIGFKHSGAYVAKFFMKWTEDGQPR